MDTPIDLLGQADVYGDTSGFAANQTAGPAARCAIRLSVERSPMALSRVFGLIGTVAMIPALSRTIGEDDVIDVVLEFLYADAYKLDLLCRKLTQLTETIQLRVVPG